MRWLDDITDSMDTEFEQTPEDGEVQRSLASCSQWGCKELDLSERLNNNRSLRYKNFIFDNRLTELVSLSSVHIVSSKRFPAMLEIISKSK